MDAYGRLFSHDRTTRLAEAPIGAVVDSLVFAVATALLAVSLGLLAAIVGYLLPDGSAYLGLVVMLAMWGNLMVAGFAGAFVPVLLEKLGVDPAVASSVFFTALTDLFGFFLLLGLASWILLPQL